MRTLFALLILSATSACQADSPACDALLSCCAALSGNSLNQCLEAHSVFRTNEYADLLCADASQAYGCQPDAGAWYPDSGYSSDVGRDFDVGSPGSDAAAPSFDGGRSSDAGPAVYPDAGGHVDVGSPGPDAGRPRSDAGPGPDSGRPRPDSGPPRTDAGPDF